VPGGGEEKQDTIKKKKRFREIGKKIRQGKEGRGRGALFDPPRLRRGEFRFGGWEAVG